MQESLPSYDERAETLNREHALRAHERGHEMANAARKAATDSATVAIRSLILVNGGAVVALLAFIGSLAKGGDAAVHLVPLVAAIKWFAFGVGFGATAAALAYIVNMLDTDIITSTHHTWEHPYVEEQPKTFQLRKVRIGFHLTALACAAGALVAFFCGIHSVTGAILKLGL